MGLQGAQGTAAARRHDAACRHEAHRGHRAPMARAGPEDGYRDAALRAGLTGDRFRALGTRAPTRRKAPCRDDPGALLPRRMRGHAGGMGAHHGIRPQRVARAGASGEQRVGMGVPGVRQAMRARVPLAARGGMGERVPSGIDHAIQPCRNTRCTADELQGEAERTHSGSRCQPRRGRASGKHATEPMGIPRDAWQRVGMVQCGILAHRAPR